MNDFLTALRTNWMFVIFIAGLIVSWTLFDSRLSAAEAKITGLDTTNEQIKQIQIDLAVIKEKVSSENISRQVQLGVSEALSIYEIPN